ncbi:HGGxSTG domain-containing protein [Cycloclasticus pugetii]|uniref:HGGxSTG domain-containing protein n=1 Tax=Cycloclasticus pugetii TaxID=34068 RepID=UPI003A94A033
MGKWNGLPHEPQYLCGAFARTTGKPCKRFASKNGRCKLHGGRSTGAINPVVKHGRYTKESVKLRKQYVKLLSNSKTLINKIVL